VQVKGEEGIGKREGRLKATGREGKGRVK